MHTVPTVAQQASGSPAEEAYLKRAFLSLEDGDWENADRFCENVLNLNPECAEVYLAKLMVELKVNNREYLADESEPFDDNGNYKKAIRFGNQRLKDELNGYIDQINARVSYKNNNVIYQNGLCLLEFETDAAKLLELSQSFKSISGHRDADARAAECIKKIDQVMCKKWKNWKWRMMYIGLKNFAGN